MELIIACYIAIRDDNVVCYNIVSRKQPLFCGLRAKVALKSVAGTAFTGNEATLGQTK